MTVVCAQAPGSWGVLKPPSEAQPPPPLSPPNELILCIGVYGELLDGAPSEISDMQLTYSKSSSSDWLRMSHVTQYRCGFCKLEYLLSYYEGTLMLL